LYSLTIRGTDEQPEIAATSRTVLAIREKIMLGIFLGK